MLTRYQHIGDPGEFGDWIVAVIALVDFDQKSLAAALSAIVTATSDLEHFLQLPEEKARCTSACDLASTARWMHR